MTAAKELALGANVIVNGIVVGKTEFSDRTPTYWVEYERQGKRVRDWFTAAELAENDAPVGTLQWFHEAREIIADGVVIKSNYRMTGETE